MLQSLSAFATRTSTTPPAVTSSICASVITAGCGCAASAVDPAVARPKATKIHRARFMGFLLYVGLGLTEHAAELLGDGLGACKRRARLMFEEIPAGRWALPSRARVESTMCARLGPRRVNRFAKSL